MYHIETKRQKMRCCWSCGH